MFVFWDPVVAAHPWCRFVKLGVEWFSVLCFRVSGLLRPAGRRVARSDGQPAAR